jgi:hypothetical protein
MLGTDYAIWECPMEIHPAGSASAMKGYAVDIMRKVGRRWLTLETHPKLYPPPAVKP